MIQGYLDGELDLAGSLEMERHLRACPECSRASQGYQDLKSAIHSSPLYYRAPGNLPKRIRSAVRAAGGSENKPRILSGRRLSAVAALAVIAILASILLALLPRLLRQTADQPLAQEVLSSHVRSLMANHLTDVSSSDQHTVKPWFNGRLDFSPAVKDLTDQGFPLIGGRLDYLENRPVAALVYRRQQHFINLFSWPANSFSHHEEPRRSTRQGYRLIHWVSAGMNYWAVSDLNENELGEFVRIIRSGL